jgi:hypothetical protein
MARQPALLFLFVLMQVLEFVALDSSIPVSSSEEGGTFLFFRIAYNPIFCSTIIRR